MLCWIGQDKTFLTNAQNIINNFGYKHTKKHFQHSGVGTGLKEHELEQTIESSVVEVVETKGLNFPYS